MVDQCSILPRLAAHACIAPSSHVRLADNHESKPCTSFKTHPHSLKTLWLYLIMQDYTIQSFCQTLGEKHRFKNCIVSHCSMSLARIHCAEYENNHIIANIGVLNDQIGPMISSMTL